MRRLARSVLGALAVVALAGCWPQVGGTADNGSSNGSETRLTPATVGGITEVWRNPIPEAQGLGLSLRGPVSDGRRVYVTLGGCGIAAVRLGDGGSVWAQPGANTPCANSLGQYINAWTPPFVVGDKVMWGWTANIPINPRDPVLIESLEAFDAATGTRTTPPPIGGALPQTVRGSGGLAYWMREIRAEPPLPPVFISWAPVLHLASPTGVGSRDLTYSALPTLGRDSLFVYDNGPMATEPGDPATGPALRAYDVDEPVIGCGAGTAECPRWVTPLAEAPVGLPVVSSDQQTVYVVSATGNVHAVDATTGAVRWTASVGGEVVEAPALARGVLIVSTKDGRLVALDANCEVACVPRWEATPGNGTPPGRPAVGGDVVYVATGSADGGLAAYAVTGCGAATCPPLWAGSAGAAIAGQPIVANGRLVVTTQTSVVVAFGLPS